MASSSESSPDARAVGFAASGLAYLKRREGEGAIARQYIVTNDGQAFLLSPSLRVDRVGDDSAFRPVPETLQSAIRSQHPDLPLDFPASALQGPNAEPSGELVEIDPRKLVLIYGARHIDKAELFAQGGGVLDGDWDAPHHLEFEQTDIYRGLHEHFVDGVRWEETAFYARVLEELRAGNRKWGCHTEEDFQHRCAGLDALYADIRDHGFRTQRELGTDLPDDDVRVAVRRDGRLLFIDGRHRVSIARIHNLESIPVRIVARHAEWEAFKAEMLAYARRHGGRIYQAIDHPDLRDMPATHTSDRHAILGEALAGGDWTGKRLLDVGAHWGAMTQYMEGFGFVCTAVEANRENAEFARRLQVATESSYQVWKGNIFSFPDAEQQDVVLALSIFHHFLKTEEAHAQLIAFLGRLNVSMILFEAHRPDPPGQMAGAYRNYPQDEFAAFVAEHAGLSNIEKLGQRAGTGRTLFRIT